VTKRSCRSRSWALEAVLAGLVGLSPAMAAAQGVPADADKLYSEAAAAMIKKDYATACPKFEQVTRMVPDGGGVRLNLAECYEEAGKLASAYNQYGLAEALAVKDGRKDRQKAAAKGAARVKPKMAMVILQVPDQVRGAPEVVIKLDGEVLAEKVWGVPYPVDRGRHELVATAKGYEPATVHVEIAKDGTTTKTSLPDLKKAVVSAPEAPGTSAPGPGVGPATTTVVTIREESGGVGAGARIGAVLGGGALAVGGIVAGGVVLGMAVGKGHERERAQKDPFGREAANAAANEEAGLQSAAIGCFVGGGVAAAGTVVFYLLTRPKGREGVKAGGGVGPSGASVWIEGRF